MFFFLSFQTCTLIFSRKQLHTVHTKQFKSTARYIQNSIEIGNLVGNTIGMAYLFVL